MRYLLDTHTLLWMRDNNPHINRAKWEPVFYSPGNQILFSVASLWEMSIKRSLAKLDFKGSIEDFASALQLKHGFDLLPVSSTDPDRVAMLPHHHRDPFDRLPARTSSKAPAASARATQAALSWRRGFHLVR